MRKTRTDFVGLYRQSRRQRPHRPAYVREEVFARWGYRCAYCNAPAEHLDHLTPISAGGADVLRNVIPACAACNYAKGAQSLAEWASTFA